MPPGRPSLGTRRQVNVRLPPDLVAAIDRARGISSRDSWMENAARLALKPTSVYVEPELQQQVHTHEAGMPLRTEFRPGGRIRIYRCKGCDMEVVA